MDILFKHLKDIKKSVIDDVKRVVKFHEKEHRGGYHGIPRQVFCYINHLGAIVFGENNTGNAVKFINLYFPKTYKNKSEIIYEMWRHGTVHSYEPKTLVKDHIVLTWLSDISPKKNNRKSHLWVLRKKAARGHKIFYLKINVNQLVDDLIWSIDKLMRELEKDTVKVEVIRENIRKYKRNKEINGYRSGVKKQFNKVTKRANALLDKQFRIVR